MNLRIAFLASPLFACLCSHAQQLDKVAFTINEKPVYYSELKQAFDESNKRLTKKETINQFLPRFIDYRLNLAEAQAECLDTTASFQREYNNFKASQAEKFLTDSLTENLFLRNIYSHLLEDREIIHVLLPYNKEDVFPSDTLTLYNEALTLREKLIKNNFKDKGYFSKQSMQIKSLLDFEQNNGYVGWVAPFMFSYPVEETIYSLNKGETSMPVRSGKGYHLVKVLDVRPARGQLTIEQVLFRFPCQYPNKQQRDSVRHAVNKIYKNIHSQEDFDILCADFAKVYNMGDRGCIFGTISLDTKLPATFTNAAFALKKPGDISKPVMTETGYHIIRLKAVIPPPSYDLLKWQLYNKVRFGDRLLYLNKQKSKSLFSKYNVSVNEDAYNFLKQATETLNPVNPEFLLKTTGYNDWLFTIDGKKSYTVKNFIDYIKTIITPSNDDMAMDLPLLFDNSAISDLSTDRLDYFFLLFSTSKIDDYAHQTLEDRYPEMKMLMEKFTEDVLVFDVKNKNIWDRASRDQLGLSDFFALNKSNYTWISPRFRGLVVHAKNNRAIENAKALSKYMNCDDIDVMDSEVRQKLNTDSVNVQIEKGIWAQGENSFVDNQLFSKVKPETRKNFPYFCIIGKLITAPETYKDDKARVENDYQSLLEKEWTNSLRQKYKVKINNDIIRDL